MKIQALQYYMHDGDNAFRFELAGNLNRDAAIQIDQAWRTASSVIGDRILIVDMTFVHEADAAGRALLARWHREGARLIAGSKVSRALAESIVGEPLPPSQLDARCTPTSQRTWRSFLALSAGVIVVLGLLMFPARASAAAGGDAGSDILGDTANKGRLLDSSASHPSFQHPQDIRDHGRRVRRFV